MVSKGAAPARRYLLMLFCFRAVRFFHPFHGWVGFILLLSLAVSLARALGLGSVDHWLLFPSLFLLSLPLSLPCPLSKSDLRAGNGAAEECLDVLAERQDDGLVGGGQRVGVVGEGLALVDDVLALELEGHVAAVGAVGLLAQHGDDGRLADVGVHGEVVDAAGLEVHVVQEGGADVLAVEERVEGDVALDAG